MPGCVGCGEAIAALATITEALEYLDAFDEDGVQREPVAPVAEPRAIKVGSVWRGKDETDPALGLRTVTERDAGAGTTTTVRNGGEIHWGPEFRLVNEWVRDPEEPATGLEEKP